METPPEIPPSLRAALAAKRGGVAPVLPRTSGAARSGRAIADKSRKYNNIEKGWGKHPPAIMGNTPPLTVFPVP